MKIAASLELHLNPPEIIHAVLRALHGVEVRLCMKGGTIVNVAPLNVTYDMRVHPHVYMDVLSLLLMAAIESDGAGDEVGTMIVVKAKWEWSVSSRCH